jgi:hypothetical protein
MLLKPIICSALLGLSLSCLDQSQASAQPLASTLAKAEVLNSQLNRLSNPKLEANLIIRVKRVQYNAPKGLGAPKYVRGGLVRGSCPENSCLIALMPGSRFNLDHFPATLAAHPTFFFSMPQPEGYAAFILDRINDDGISATRFYKKKFWLESASSGIVNFTLPEDAPPLEIGRSYSWKLQVDYLGGGSETVSGFVHRVEPEPGLLSQLKRSQPLERPAIYAKAGLWFETVTTLAGLRCTQPDRPEPVDEWVELLSSVKLNAIAKLPLSKCND